jgi:hypothetical protein
VLEQGHMLLDAGASAVLAKGSHGTGASLTDLLLRRNEPPRRTSST